MLSNGITSEQIILESMSVDEYYQELLSAIMFNEAKEAAIEKQQAKK